MDAMETQELKDRLALIEQMMKAGRRSTESWGWTFVLWGVAYYVAIGWSALGGTYAWPVTMVATCVLMGVILSRRDHKPNTTMNRAIVGVWIALGVTMMTLMPALAISGRFADARGSIAVVCALLGMANGASGIVLKWRLQQASAVTWWGASMTVCFGSEMQALVVFMVAIFFCQVVFGIACMIAEAREARAMKDGAHA
jgi:hypothetical protein